MGSPTIQELYDLTGKVALVTGGARNLGFDMATALAEAGADVAIISRSLESAQASARRISEDTGRAAAGFACDVRFEDQVEATVDAVLGTGLPLRSQRALADIPSAYAAAPVGQPVLDCYGRSLDGTSGELEMWTRNLGCYYQAHHGRPILEFCVRTEVQSPREAWDAALGHALLNMAGRDDPAGMRALRSELVGAEIGAVALHADFYRPADRELMLAGLEGLLGPPLADSHDGGERVVLFHVATGGLAPAVPPLP